MIRFLLTLVLWIAIGCPGAEHYQRSAGKAHDRHHAESEARDAGP